MALAERMTGLIKTCISNYKYAKPPQALSTGSQGESHRKGGQNPERQAPVPHCPPPSAKQQRRALPACALLGHSVYETCTYIFMLL
jgi:hypothetical protein